MISVSAAQLLKVWETAMQQHPIERALTLLTLSPNSAKEDLAKFSVGQRNNELMQLRKAIFGQIVACFVNCVFCNEALEFTVNLTDLIQADTYTAKKQVNIDGYQIIFRSITSADLLSIKNANDISQASRKLLELCILDCQLQQQAIAADQLPDAVVNSLAKEMAGHDPQAEILFNLACANCSREWQAPFDIATILWEEIQRNVSQLLDEVHQLAIAYGWRETDILALAPWRRQFYLNKLL